VNSGNPFNERQGASSTAPAGESKAMEGEDDAPDSPPGSDDRKPSPTDPKIVTSGRDQVEIKGGRESERGSPPSEPSPKSAETAPARSSQLQHSSSPARSSVDGAMAPRRRRPRYTLDQLEDIAVQVRDADTLDVDEKQRQMGIVYSKRKRLRAKLREKCIEEERDSLVVDNDRLQRENGQLEAMLKRALRTVSEIEAGGGFGACLERKGPPPDDLRRANQRLKSEPSFLSSTPGPAPNRLIQDMMMRHQNRALPDSADDTMSALPRPSSVPSFVPQRSLLDLQLLGRNDPVPQFPSFSSSSHLLLPDVFNNSRPSSTPDLALLSRSYGLLQERLAVQNEHRRHLNAALSASLPSPAAAADPSSRLGAGLEALLSAHRSAAAAAAAGPFDDSALGQLHLRSLLSSRAVSASAALAAASAAAAAASSASAGSALLNWEHQHEQQWQPDPAPHAVPSSSASSTLPPAMALLGMLPAHEQLVLSRMDAMSASDLLALYRHFRGTSPVAAQIVGQSLRRRLEAASAASNAAAARHINDPSR
jgi:hypothetical protein